MAAEMASKLPHKIDVETTERMMGPEIVMPMCVSLLQEIGYFNDLISFITFGLKVSRFNSFLFFFIVIHSRLENSDASNNLVVKWVWVL